MTVQLTVDAEQDIEGIYYYSITNFGEKQADLYYLNPASGLSDHFTYIANNLETSRSFNFVKERLLRSNFENHAIYYRQEDDGILILRVLHQRMDPLRHLT
jgi:toxin ParE1/3/4